MVHFAKTENISELHQLLKSVNLPYTDIEKHIHNFVYVRDEKHIAGCIGLEVYGDTALLRSLAVNKEHQNRGLGTTLTREILQHARTQHIKEVYLLTTTAERFFHNFGFKTVDRNTAPETIQSTAEFSSLCPSTAVLMFKEIN
jgi:amino-acid N-acetyltransferase